MKLSNNLLRYLSNSSQILNAGIIITDLSHIVYANMTFYKDRSYSINENDYINHKITDDLHDIIMEWTNINCFNNELFKMYNKEKNMITLKLVENDKIPYYAQLIFPLFHNNKLNGLFICFRIHRNYNNSSVKSVITTRNFTEIMSDNNYLMGASWNEKNRNI